MIMTAAHWCRNIFQFS